ncbi:MAG: rRNA pseudouridine synthase [Limnochordaceae bacterium]|nr:rRNA pseudouridine synthase [Limnochordaceae bacterium]
MAGKPVRLHKYLAMAGVASRRAAEALIRQGRVSVNGEVVTAMGWAVDPDRDRVALDGREVRPLPPGRLVYIVLHKPRGVVSSARDERGRVTVVDWVLARGGPPVRLFPVGRLDFDSEGLVLLTNDGPLAHGLLHPSHHVPRTYRVLVQGAVDPPAVEALERGVRLEDGLTLPARVMVRSRGRAGSLLDITLYEGRKRQVRRMCEAVGHPVLRLVRLSLGPVRLGRLAPGQWRYLSGEELSALRRAARLPDVQQGGRR